MLDPSSKSQRTATLPSTEEAQITHATPVSFADLSASIQALKHELPRQDIERLGSGPTLAFVQSLDKRALSIVDSFFLKVANAPTPISSNARQTARHLQELLRTLADTLLKLAANPTIRATRNNTPPHDATLLRDALDILTQHLLIGFLTKTSPNGGLWQQLHQAYTMAIEKGQPGTTPSATPPSFQDLYYSTVLLGCAQPATFSAEEVLFLYAYLRRYACEIDFNCEKPLSDAVLFWTDPASDIPATPTPRKRPTPDTPVSYFSCSRLVMLIRQQILQLEAGEPSDKIGLPDFANTTAGQGALRRLADILETPRKRRFPRRRQNFRVEMCFGVDNILALVSASSRPAPESLWMITNESPDGYAAMHISGKGSAVDVGDVAALRTEGLRNWQLCLIRRFHSNNPEHIELGLQILAPRILPASVAIASPCGMHTVQHPAIFIPTTPAIRENEGLIVPANALPPPPTRLVLIVEGDNLSVREIRTIQREEQRGRIEIFQIKAVEQEE